MGERENQHPFLYAGKGMGADIAAWKQAARAELATTAQFKVGYAQALLDLVKAFDRIPHWLIVREAIALGYPLWFIRLPFQAYKLKRVIKVRDVVSKEVQAYRGITAGSGTATSEMRLVMIRIIIKAIKAHPTVVPSCFVDDLSAEATGPDKAVVQELGGFVRNVAESFDEAEMELSKTKSVCTASTESLGKELEANLKDLAVNFEKTVKSLGVGLGAGVRRNTKVMATRIRNLAARVHRFRMLKQLGFDTSMLLRTGVSRR